MSYSEKKITQAEIDARNVKSAPDVLVGNAGDNKQVFDRLPEYIAEKYNSLMDDLDGTQGDIDADISSIGSEIDAINETLATKADNVDFAGATATEAGEHGLVPPLAAGNRKHVLFGSGQWHQLDIDAWQNDSSVNVGLTTDKSAGGTYIRYSTASIPVATPTQPGAMSATDKSKLDNIASGAEVNVQSDWNETDTASDAFVKNKPTIDATLDPDSANAVQNWRIVEALDQKADDEYTQQQFTLISGYLNGKVDKVSGKGLSTNDYTTAEKNKLAGIATGAEVNVQSDWNQANTSADDYIKNKPTIVTPADLNAAITAEQTAREQADSEIETIALNAYINKTASGAIATFTDGANAPMKSCMVSIVPKQSGTGTPSPDNVRQISGWESVKTSVTGVNVWDEEWKIGAFNTRGEFVTGYNFICSKSPIRVFPNTAYTTNTNILIWEYDADMNIIRDSVQTSSGTIFTTSNNAQYINFRTSQQLTTYNHDISINYPSTDTDYHAYNGTTTPVNLGRTVYGGTLDVVSGVLTVDRVMVDLGTLAWEKASAGIFYSQTIDNYKTVPNWITVPNIMCSWYQTTYADAVAGASIDKAVANYGTQSRVFIRDTTYSNLLDFKSAMNGVQLVYELATPQTYTLTPTEVKTLLGENNVWADSGDVGVVYRADPTLAYQELANAITALGGNV